MPLPTPSFGVATKDSAPLDSARGTVGTVYPWAVPALFDGEGVEYPVRRKPVAFYNEIDPFAAAWLRELITAGLIAPGIVDERDIRDIRPDELAGYTQCHFFAGIGVWSYALRQAGWPDDRPVWTGSCPCQPFSAAGGRGGFADERHLWPAFYWLIAQCRPEFVFGEQVASGAANDWLDLVQADLEAVDYPFGCVPIPVAGVGAPHIRDRAFWLAHAMRRGAEYTPGRGVGEEATLDRRHGDIPGERLRIGVEGPVGGLADSNGRNASAKREQPSGEHGQLAQDCGARRMGDTSDEGFSLGSQPAIGPRTVRDKGAAIAAPSPVNGFWGNAQWIWCSDERWRPVEPGTFPLAHGAPARVGRLRGYGNAINAEVATAFIEAALDVIDGPVPPFVPDDAELSGDLPSFQSVCGCQPNADHAAFAGVFTPFHEPMTSAGDA